MNFSETTFVLPPRGRRPREDADLHARRRRSRSPATRRSAPRSSSPAPLQLIEIRIETGRGIVPVQLEREGARIVFGRMEQPTADDRRRSRGRTSCRTRSASRSRLPVEVYDNGLAHVYVALGSEDEVAALRPDWQRLAGARRRRHQLLRRRRDALEDADVRARVRRRRGSGDRLRRGAARAPPRAPRADRLRRRDRDRRRASRSAGPRRSTRARTRPSTSRSAAPPSSSRAASSALSRRVGVVSATSPRALVPGLRVDGPTRRIARERVRVHVPTAGSCCVASSHRPTPSASMPRDRRRARARSLDRRSGRLARLPSDAE